MNIGDWIRKRCQISPHHTAIIFEDNRKQGEPTTYRFTYRELNARVNRLANALLGKGIGKGDRVATFCYNCHQMLEIYFAISKIGAIIVPLNFRLEAPETTFMLRDSGSTAIVFQDYFSEIIRSLQPSVHITSSNYFVIGGKGSPWENYEEILKMSSPEEPEIEEEVELDDPQMIMYTSGTTGVPKGALMSHKKTFYNTLNSQMYFDLTSRDIMLVVMPLFHSGGLNMCALPILYQGGTAVIQSAFNPEETLALIQKYKITTGLVVPTMLNLFLKTGGIDIFDLSSLRLLLISGEPLPVALIEEYKKRNIYIRQAFGQTETSTQLCQMPNDEDSNKIGSVGRSVFYADIRLVDKNGNDVGPGEAGEIILKGPTQMLGYWNNPEETAKTIRDGWLYTGDLARMDEDGYVYMIDRARDVIISGGENIYPAEIERVYASHPKILEVAVIGVPDARWGEVGKALIVLKEGETMTEEEAIGFLKGKVAKYKIPKRVEFTNEFPKTASGKIKKSELKKRYASSR
jgi:fatty-acyl-CoA synthase